MTARMFRLLELNQKLDKAIQHNRRSGNAGLLQIAQLKFRQQQLKSRLRQIVARQTPLLGA